MTNRGRKFPRECLTIDESNRFVDAFGRGPTAIRNRAMIVVMLRAGLRLQEVLDLERRDLSAAERTMHVRHGKGDKARIVKLDVAAWALLDLWLQARQKLPQLHSRVVFVTLGDKKLSQQYVRAMCGRMAKRSGIEKRVHPHGLRHTYAETMVAAGMGLLEIQCALGHERASTTDIYLGKLRPQALLDAVDRLPPWRRVR